MKILKDTRPRLTIFLSSIFGPALIIQIAPAIGLFLTILVSLFYFLIEDDRYPIESPAIPLLFASLSFLLAGIGFLIQKVYPPRESISLRRGAWIVFWAWVIACTVSSLYFYASNFPIPSRVEEFSFLRQFIDGFYETMSGYTTTGASILPSVEVFPRSLLFWRTLLHWIGGMGIAFLAVTLVKKFSSSRQAVINSESEAHEIVYFSSQEEARGSGWSFLRAYALISGIMLVLLLVSGSFFRVTPYTHWYDNAFDAVTHTFSTIGTGGFGTYDLSAGLPSAVTEDGAVIIGGLQNKVSEWIIAFFMVFAGVNFSLWYILFFRKDKKFFWSSIEHRVYWLYVLLCTAGIAYFLWRNQTYQTIEEILRYAFFNVASVVSTTGLANWDFISWPQAAIGILFVCYLVGGMVGSTSGGPKVIRYIISYHHIKRQLSRLIYGIDQGSFTIDRIKYGDRSSGLVVTTVAIYFLIFTTGTILLLIFANNSTLPDGTHVPLNFGTAISASIAHLGNIGPGLYFGNSVNIGPTGNYFAFNEAGKVILIALMYIGRVGILAVIMLFLKTKGEKTLSESVSSIQYDKSQPVLKQ